MNKNIIRITILISTVLIISLIIYFGWKSATLQVVSTTPKTDEVTVGTSAIDIEFSKEINAVEYEKNIVDPDKIVTGITMKDQNLVSLKIDNLVLGKKYSIGLKDITAKSGGSIGKYNLEFTPKNIDFADLSEEEKRRQIDETDKREFEDPLEATLPHETSNYKMTFITRDESTDLPATITITMKFFEPGSNALPATPAEKQEYLNNIRKYRTEALEYLKSNGIDINNYVLEYTELDLREEFPVGYQPQPEL